MTKCRVHNIKIANEQKQPEMKRKERINKLKGCTFIFDDDDDGNDS